MHYQHHVSKIFMKIIRIYSCLIFCIWLGCLQVIAQQFNASPQPEKVLEMLKKQNSETKSIQADFQEEKFLSYLNTPQSSKGKFYYQENDKMRWEQVSPFPYTLLVNGDKIVVKENGVSKDVSSSTRVTGRMSNLLMALIKGDFQSSGTFSSKVMESKDAYKILLTPTDKRMKNYYQEIQMVFAKGSLQLKELTFLEKKGNRTVTRFSNEKINHKLNGDLFSVL